MSADAYYESLIDEAKLAYEEARRRLDLAEGCYRYALSHAAWSWCVDRGIWPSPTCRVEIAFADGKEVCIFDHIDWHTMTPIRVRRLSKKGKPYKTLDFCEWHYVKLMKKCD